MNEHVLNFVLPDSAPVNSATLSIPNHFKFLNWEGHESLTDLTNFTRELNHILSLIPEDELDEADYEPNCGWHLFTTNQGAIKYAFDHGFLCEHCTACSSAYDQMTEGNVCKDCWHTQLPVSVDPVKFLMLVKGETTGKVFKPVDIPLSISLTFNNGPLKCLTYL